MAYVQGGLIDSADFNTFRSQALNVYGTGNGNVGYGQTALSLPIVAGGFVEEVKSAEWTDFRNIINTCATHQGTATTLLPPTTDLEVGDQIVAHDGITNADDFSAMLTNITTNRLTAAAASTSVSFGELTTSTTSAWSSQIVHTAEFSWPTADEARYFFNSGGEIIIRMSRTDGSATDQNTAWTSLMSTVGSIVLNYDATNSTGGGSGTALGYYDLTPNTYATIFTASTGGGYVYAGTNIVVRAQTRNVDGTNGDNGRTVRIEVQLNDTYTGASDVVDGTTSITFDERRATTSLTITPFTASNLGFTVT